MDSVKSVWYGNTPLYKTFWLYGLCPYFLIVGGIYLLFKSSFIVTTLGIHFFLFLSFYALIYFPFINISTWRSADKYEDEKKWPIITKIIVMLGWIYYIKNAYIISVSVF